MGVLNGIVAVGHSDDTDDEASDDEEVVPVQNCSARSTLQTSDEDNTVTATAAENIDLLSMSTPVQAPVPTVPTVPTQSADLLDVDLLDMASPVQAPALAQSADMLDVMAPAQLSEIS